MVSGEEADSSGANRWIPWYGPLALVIGFVAALVSGVVIEVIGHAQGASINNPPPSVVDLSTIAEEVGFVFSAVWVASFVGRPRREQFGLRPPLLWRRAVLAVPLTYLGFIVISAIWSAALNTSASEKHLVKDVGGHSGTIGILAACLVTCVVAPICEEFLFRGFIFRALRNWRGPWPAAVLTGVLFGAIHVGSAPAVDLVPLGVLGIMLCAIREWSGSLYPCIALHALNNSIALGIDESWGWQIAALMLSSLALISLTLVLSARLSSVRLA